MGPDAGVGSCGSFVEEFGGVQMVRTMFRIEPRMEAAVLGWESRGPVTVLRQQCVKKPRTVG